jgi:DNA-binding CsgD family transcriptional regulator
LPALHVGGLAITDARRLLLDSLDGPLDGSVAARIVAECRGNPRVILGLPGTWTAPELAGGYAVPDGRRLAAISQRGWVDRIARLPADTRLLVLTAASEPLGDPLILRRAAELLGVDPRAVAPAVEAGLLQVHARVQFAHPLLRDVAYGASDPDVRARVHRALATATDPDADGDRRAWHTAAATCGADEAVATALETSAAQAHARAGLGAAAAFLARATELSPDPRARARRAVDAAAAALEAGSLDRTRLLLDVARSLPADEPLAARADLVAARLALASAPGNDATTRLLQAARRLEPFNRRLARETCLDALASAVVGSRADEPGGVREAARAGRALLPTDGGSSTVDLVLAALVDLAEDGAATAACRTALGAVVEDSARGESRWLWHGTVIALATWDDATARLLGERFVQRARVSGAVGQLALALGAVVTTSVLDGELSAAAPQAALSAALLLHAWRGRAEDRVAVDHQRAVAAARGDAHAVSMADYGQAVLCNGAGEHEQALTAALRAVVEHDAVVGGWCWAELVEAAVRSGRDDLAAEAAQELRRRADAAGTAWASGMAARASALVAAGSDAEASFRQAVGHLRRAQVRAELARTHLLHGEWLRHVGRPSDARVELHTAHDAFVAMGMEAFAARARAQLALAGGAVRPLGGGQDALTAQEAQIAGLARDGLSNPEIGARLFLSSRTVEWHLRKVFTKLGIGSRRELRAALGGPD